MGDMLTAIEIGDWVAHCLTGRYGRVRGFLEVKTEDAGLVPCAVVAIEGGVYRIMLEDLALEAKGALQ